MKVSEGLFGRNWPPLSERRTLLIRIVLLALFFANALSGAIRNSGVCDELAAHIPCGYLYWTSGQFSGGINNVPLGQLLIALPVKLLGYSYELFTEEHLLLFRLPVLLMGLILANLVYCFASKLYGRPAGLAALLLFSFSPNILANATIATLDLPITLFIFLAIYLLLQYIEKPNISRMLAFSIVLSAAMLTKVQALLLIPITLLTLIVFLRQLLPAGRRDKFIFFASWLLMPITAFLLVNLAYLHLPTDTGDWLPAQFVGGVKAKLLHSTGGHFCYLLGEYSDDGWWYYFPVVILLKTPLPTLVLLVIGLLRKHSRKTLMFVLIPIALFLAAAMKSRINIGLRHILIIYPFLFVLGGYAATTLWKTGWHRVLLAILLVWYFAEAVFITPHHLSYFNVLARGPKHGHEYLIDSNFDWGQNDHFLRRYIEKKGIQYKINPPAFKPTTGHILVNANARYGVINGGASAYTRLKSFQPINQIAYTWFEYHVPEEAFPQPPDYESVRRRLLIIVFDLKERSANIDNEDFRLSLAQLFASVRAYDVALDELRSILSHNAAYSPALLLGGELTVRHKLGVLEFQGDEYLTGFHTHEPAGGVSVDDNKLIRLARAAGIGTRLSQLYNKLGVALFYNGDRRGAMDAIRQAVRFDSKNQEAVANLKQLLPSNSNPPRRDAR